MILAIDTGNTRLKWGLFNTEHQLLEAGACMHADMESAPFYLWNECEHAVVASVARESVTEQVLRILERYRLPVRQVQATQSACGLLNGYDKPTQLGVDRWAAAVAAWQNLHASCVVVSVGTAVTVDAIEAQPDGQGKFLGGYILPGMKLMQTRLGQGTANVQAEHGQSQAFPTNTSDAVHSGTYAALGGAVLHMVQQLSVKTGQRASLLVTGGDAANFYDWLTNAAQTLHQPEIANQLVIADNLVLHGILLLESNH